MLSFTEKLFLPAFIYFLYLIILFSKNCSFLKVFHLYFFYILFGVVTAHFWRFVFFKLNNFSSFFYIMSSFIVIFVLFKPKLSRKQTFLYQSMLYFVIWDLFIMIFQDIFLPRETWKEIVFIKYKKLFIYTGYFVRLTHIKC